MATLNIKGMPEPIMKKLRARARAQRRSLTQEVIRILADATRPEKQHSILELKGLGKELWRGIDAAAYVKAERDSWD